MASRLESAARHDERLVFVKELAEGEAAPEGDTFKVVESEKTGTTEKTRSVYELRESPTCKLFRLGFTKQEVEEALK